MRTTLIAATLLLAGLTAGCKRKADPVPEPVFPLSRLSATVDGHAFQSTDVSAVLSGASLFISANLNGGSSKASGITLTMPYFNGTGTYPIDTANEGSYFELSGSYIAQSGSITITSSSTAHIAGKFSFEAATGSGAIKAVTNGSFDIYK